MVIAAASSGTGRAISFDYRQRHLLSTQRRQAGILVNVHSDRPVSAEAGNSNLSAQVRMDNLLKANRKMAGDIRADMGTGIAE